MTRSFEWYAASSIRNNLRLLPWPRLSTASISETIAPARNTCVVWVISQPSSFSLCVYVCACMVSDRIAQLVGDTLVDRVCRWHVAKSDHAIPISSEARYGSKLASNIGEMLSSNRVIAVSLRRDSLDASCIGHFGNVRKCSSTYESTSLRALKSLHFGPRFHDVFIDKHT